MKIQMSNDWKPEVLFNDWKPETKSLFNTLKKHGIVIVKVDNGESVTEFAKVTLKQFIDETTACDEANLYVTTPDGKMRWIFLVYGNSPGELVCDHHCNAEIEAASNEHFDAWNGRAQPRCKSPY